MTTTLTLKNVSKMYYPLSHTSAGCFRGRYNWAVVKTENGVLYGAQMNKERKVTVWSNRLGAKAFLQHGQPQGWFRLVGSLDEAKTLSQKL